jgi:hypothetical protein
MLASSIARSTFPSLENVIDIAYKRPNILGRQGPTRLVTGLFRKQFDATDAVLREFCGIGAPGEIDSNRLAAILGPTARLRRPKR